VVDLLSLRIKKNYGSKAEEYVIFVDASLGLISARILLNILLNLLVKSEIDSLFYLLKFLNSEM
jgi:hypothetical protein